MVESKYVGRLGGHRHLGSWSYDRTETAIAVVLRCQRRCRDFMRGTEGDMANEWCCADIEQHVSVDLLCPCWLHNSLPGSRSRCILSCQPSERLALCTPRQGNFPYPPPHPLHYLPSSSYLLHCAPQLIPNTPPLPVPTVRATTNKRPCTPQPTR